MKKCKRFIPFVLAMLFLIPLAYLYYVTAQFGFYGEWKEKPATPLTNFTMEIDGTTTDITLPYVFDDREEYETVVLSTQVKISDSDRIYLKSVYSPLRVFINGKLFYEYGEIGTYPSYFEDPPVQVIMLQLPDEPFIDLQLEYTHPTTREDLNISPPLVGTYPSIFSALLNQQESFSFLFIFLLGFGLLLFCIGLFVRTFEEHGVLFIWLGLIALLCSLWGLGEYDISGIFIHNEAILYLMGFTGIYYLPVPIYFYFRSTVGYRNPKPITICGYIAVFVAVMSSILQATSVLSFYNCLPYFAVVTTVCFFFSIGYTIYEWHTHENQMAKQFLLPWIIVIASAIIEFIRLSQEKTIAHGQIAQIGVLAFLLVNSIIGGFLVRKTLAQREQIRIMEHEYKMMEMQVSEQQRYRQLLMETRQTLQQQRHDLHHQVTVLHGLAKEGNLDKLDHHINTLEVQLPEELQTYCDNIAVNTVVAHYIAKAKAHGVTVNINLVVPEPVEQIGDNNLCVIFGNILENAVEACGRMSDSGQFITLTSYLRNGMLVIILKNSFEGPLRQEDDKFYSSKRDDFGIGLTSVQAVARKHGGNAVFTTEGRVFQSAIYVRI